MRAPVEGDLAQVARLASEHSPEPVGEAAVRQEWSAPRVDLELDARVEDDACVLVERLDEARVWMDVQGRPSRELLDWAESRATALGTKIFSGGWSTNRPVLEALEQRGFRLARHSRRMLADLADASPGPVWPAGIQARSFRPGDERVFYEVHQETFRDSWEPVEEPYDEWAHWLLTPPSFVPDLWFLAHENGEPAGIAICHPHRALADLGWVRILGVRRPWRRRGLGRALLLHAFEEFRRRGCTTAGLGVDAESLTGAHRLYEEVGMRVTSRFDMYEKTTGP
ncbi:MAG TPA: GNAT family N-acetyltransferase [Gaiellaceae bacterium]|nr:GNAT family N-acetyltransferase [Gaiellaceae bacterium]